MKTALIDIGLNLSSAKFHRDWRQVVEHAQKAGVESVILTGTSRQGSQAVSLHASQLPPGVAYFTAGVHPHHADEVNSSLIETLRELLKKPQAVAVGETGLDYNRDFHPRRQQRAAFEAQVALACELQKPLFLHERDASSDLLAILDEHRQNLPRCVVHCFTGNRALAEKYLERDFYLGITGWVGQSNRNADLLEALPAIPLNRMMLETDAPYLKPPGYKPVVSGRNEPAAMPIVASLVAQTLSRSVDEIRSAAYDTTIEFFGLSLGSK